MRFLRDVHISEPQAKNEILAYYKGGEALKGINGRLIGSAKKKSLYDFFVVYKEYFLSRVLKRFKIDEKEIEPLLEKVFVEEYEEIIKKATRTIKELEGLGKSRDEIVELLTTEHIERWPNLARRLKQAKKG